MRFILPISLALSLCLVTIIFPQSPLATESSIAGFYPTTHNSKKSNLPPGLGRKLVEQSCVSCHSVEIIRNKRHTLEEWRAIVTGMIALGAPLETEEQIEVLSRYLWDHFGPDDPYVI